MRLLLTLLALFLVAVTCGPAEKDSGTTEDTLDTQDGYPVEQFVDDYVVALCDRLTDCKDAFVEYYMDQGLDEASALDAWDQAYQSVCVGDPTGEIDTGCSYNTGYAYTCVQQVGQAQCSASEPLGFAMPDACYEALVCN